MLGALLDRLMSAPTEPLSELDKRTALAALLVRIAKADGHYAPEEVVQITQVLTDYFALPHGDATKLRLEAEAIEKDAPDTVRFTRALKDHVPYEDRLGVIEAAWTIALADGVRDPEEDALLRMIAPMLGIEDRDSNSARRRVANT